MEISIPTALKTLSSGGSAMKSITSWWRQSKGDLRGKINKSQFFIFLMLILMTQTVSAIEFNSTKFILNGQNIKTATWFNFEVYKIFLYLEEKNSNYEKIVSNKEKKLVKMEFLMDVSKEKLVDAWTKDVASSCIRDCERQVRDVKDFLKKMPGVNKGESVYYYITPDNIDVYVDKTKIGSIKSKFVDESVLLTMIGKTSPAKMKNKLLGIPLPQVPVLVEKGQD